jgi:hypothetical protein
VTIFVTGDVDATSAGVHAGVVRVVRIVLRVAVVSVGAARRLKKRLCVWGFNFIPEGGRSAGASAAGSSADPNELYFTRTACCSP